MSNIITIIGFIVGIFGFLFLVWKRLVDDYKAEEIFSFGFVVLGFLIVGFLTGVFLNGLFPNSSVFSPSGLWFWTAFIFGVIGFIFGFYRFKLRFFEILEGAGIAFLFWFFAVSFAFSLETTNLKLLLFSTATGILIAFFFFIDSRYKSFNWYKSGKIGFSGLTILGLFFLFRAILALFDPTMISFIGKLDAIVDSVVAFVFFVTLFNLSGNI